MTKYVLSVLALAGILAFASSCTEAPYPAITEEPTYTYNPGTMVWKDLVTANPIRSAEFYSDVFGWQITKDANNTDYYTIKNRGELIGGIWKFPQANKIDANEWLSFMSVESIDGALSKVAEGGGKALIEKQTVEGRGDIGIAVDPSGGIMGLIRASGGDPAMADPLENDWLWTELWSTDPDDAVPFFKGMGFTIEETEDDGKPYWLLKGGDKLKAGMLTNPVEGYRSTWIPYIRVGSVAKMSERIKRMGGKVILEPSADVRGGRVAIATDPLGGPFAIQEWDN